VCRAPRGKRSAAPTAREARLDLFHKHITTYGLAAFIGAVSWVK